MSIITNLLILLGSLGVFLYGMKLMSESLQKVAGEKMRSILSAMTSNRFSGILTGFLITAVIQSSSATTVMIVSFVNAGLLSLTGSISVIMGANIGTTVTAWIISLLGFKFSIANVALGVVGISFFFLFSKNNKLKSIAELIMGFALLFIGLDFLKASIPDINSNPQILDFLKNYTSLGFGSILIFVFVGTVLTVIIQSSSATMALTLVMCYNGWIPLELAAAMVLGENIGTTITANIAALVANIQARRAAVSHTVFNIFGVIWVLIFFQPFLYFIEYFTGYLTGSDTPDLMNNRMENFPIALSLFHTIFNLTNTLILAWLCPFIAKLAILIIPNKKDEAETEFKLKYIDTSYFSTDEISLMQIRKELTEFGKRMERMFTMVDQLLFEPDEIKNKDKLLERIAKYETISDRMQDEIALYLEKILDGHLSGTASAEVRNVFSIIDDLESIGDVLYHLSLEIKEENSLKITLNEEQMSNIRCIRDLAYQAIQLMNFNLNNWKNNKYNESAIVEQEINALRDKLMEAHVEDRKNQVYKFRVGVYYSAFFSLYEKVGDYIFSVSNSINKSTKQLVLK